MTDQARHLHRLLLMIKDIELARLSELSTQVRDAQSASEGLRYAEDQRAQYLAKLTAPDPALSAGVDEKWRIWSRQEAERLCEELEKIYARQETQRLQARKALGRMQAFEGLQARLSERKRR